MKGTRAKHNLKKCKWCLVLSDCVDMWLFQCLFAFMHRALQWHSSVEQPRHNLTAR